eukprot:15370229-Alexandrium_andersonii.AAC.1
MKPDEAEPGFFVGLFDQEQVQWCGAWFLANKLHGQFVWLHGLMHRRANDVNRALQRCGLYGVCLLRLFEHNVIWGPWEG